MKNLLFASLLLLSLHSAGQITITANDLPQPGQIFTLTSANAFTGMDASLTGQNYVWDYAQLTVASKSQDTVFDEAATGSLLSLFFIDNSFNPNRSNSALHGSGFNLGGQVNVSDVWNFYYAIAASYSQPGFGAIVNGAPLPVAYSPHDIIYSLPLNYNSTHISPSAYTIDLTTTIGLYYHVEKERSSITDGWGALTTPYGTFDVLRVKSTIVEIDSVYIDSLGFGFSTPPITTIEYKWLAAGEGVPVLQINTAGSGAVTQILYKDSLINTSVSQLYREDEIHLYPNPSEREFNLKLPESFSTGKISVEIFDSKGSLMQSVESDYRSGQEIKYQHQLEKGLYLMRVVTESEKRFLKNFIVE